MCSDQTIEERVYVKKDILRKVYEELKAQGFSLSQISEEIDSDFRNHLYKQTSFTKSSFQELESLYSDDIPSKKVKYIDGQGEVAPMILEKTELLAEFIGMILGDGHIDKHSYDRGDRYISSHYLCITLSSNESNIIKRAKFLAETCLGESFNEEDLNHAEAVNLKVHGKVIVQALENVGLVSGNKVVNQVNIPEWIMEDLEFQRKCLKGLFDTDGSYYQRSEDGYKVVYFKNRSENLVEGFAKICDNLDVQTSQAGENAVQVAAQRDVKKFVREVSPIKAKD